jgi:hypothetical protein
MREFCFAGQNNLYPELNSLHPELNSLHPELNSLHPELRRRMRASTISASFDRLRMKMVLFP